MTQLLEGARNDNEDMSSGFRAGKRKGWGPLAPGAFVAYQTQVQGSEAKKLSVGRVLVNERNRQHVIVQPYEGHSSGARVVHRPYFQTPFGYTLVPGGAEAKESVHYEALQQQVELLTGGELTGGSSRRLSDKGWGLLIKNIEALRFLSVVKFEKADPMLFPAAGISHVRAVRGILPKDQEASDDKQLYDSVAGGAS